VSISSALDSSSARKKNQILKGLFLTGNTVVAVLRVRAKN
jgi:hypothetical protein